MATQEILAGFKADDATVGVTGAVRVADQGTQYVQGVGLYNDLVHKQLGYISDDGIEESRDESQQEWTPWQEFSPIREEIISSKVTYAFTLWQINGVTVPFYFGIDGSQITQNPDGSWQFDEGGKPNFPKSQVYIDVIDKGRIIRNVLSAGQVSERGNIVYKSDEMIGFEVTITATPGPEGWSVRRIYYGYDMSAAAGSSLPPAPVMRTVTVTDADFTLSFGADTTASLDDTATAQDVEDALAALSSIGSGMVAVTGQAGGPYSVVLDGTLAGDLTGTGAIVSTPTE